MLGCCRASQPEQHPISHRPCKHALQTGPLQHSPTCSGSTRCSTACFCWANQLAQSLSELMHRQQAQHATLPYLLRLCRLHQVQHRLPQSALTSQFIVPNEPRALQASLFTCSGAAGSTRCSTGRRCCPNQCAKLGPAMKAAYSAAAEANALPASRAASAGGRPADLRLARKCCGHQRGTCANMEGTR